MIIYLLLLKKKSTGNICYLAFTRFQTPFVTIPETKLSLELFTSFWVQLSTFTMFLVVPELSFILISRLLLENSKARTWSLFKLSIIAITIGPSIFSLTMRFSFHVLSYVYVSVGKLLLTLTVLQKIFELTSIFRSPYVIMISFSILSIVNPLTFVIVSFGWFPLSISIFLSTFPFPVKSLTIVPSKFASTMSFSIQIVSYIYPIPIFLAALYFHIFFVSSFINFFLRDSYPQAMPFVISNLSEVDSTFVCNNMKICLFNEASYVKIGVNRLVFHQIVSVFFFFRNLEQTIWKDRISISLLRATSLAGHTLEFLFESMKHSGIFVSF